VNYWPDRFSLRLDFLQMKFEVSVVTAGGHKRETSILVEAASLHDAVVLICSVNGLDAPIGCEDISQARPVHQSLLLWSLNQALVFLGKALNERLGTHVDLLLPPQVGANRTSS
jgi:hypothetical protein